MNLRARERSISFPRRPLLMGIVNINDDSFCDDGTLEVDAAIGHAVRLASEGADIIDVGAESARTNREAISVDEETGRLLPFLRRMNLALSMVSPRDDDQVWPPLISVNTWRSDVAEPILSEGVDLLNDISGLTELTNAELCLKHGVSLLIMHTVGLPKVPHFHENYDDVWAALFAFFEARVTKAKALGLADDQLVLDPGIDFAKQCKDNLKIYGQLDRLVERSKSPVLLPISRKTVIGDVLDLPDPNTRDAGTVACLVAGMRRGAHIFRVHDVAAMHAALKVIWSVEKVSV